MLSFKTNGNDKQKLTARLWNDNVTKDIVYGGSKGSGKSFLGCSLIFGDAFTYPETNYFICRKNASDLRKFTMPSIMEVFNLWGITEDMWKFNGQDNYFTLSNGSKIYLLEASYKPSDADYARFGSIQMTKGWIEEAGEIDEVAKNNLHATIGRWNNDKYGLTGKLLQTCNPAKNYLYRDYYLPFKKGTLPEWKQFVQALPSDNKMLDKGYLESLNNILSPSQKERLLYGNWEYDDDPSVLVEYDNILNMFTNAHVLPTGERYISADIARYGRDCTVIIVWDGFVIKRLIELKKKGVAEVAEFIKALSIEYRIPMSRVVIDDDGVGGGVTDILGCRGFVNNSSPIKIASTLALPTNLENFKNLKSQCYFKLAEMVNKNEILISCPVEQDVRDRIIADFEQIKQDNMEKDMKKAVLPKEEVKKLLGRSPDFSDAIMMRIYFTLRQPSDWFIAD